MSPTIGGINFLLNAVTATIIGGTSFSGGKGNVLGTIAGGIIIGVINFSMTAFGVSTASRRYGRGPHRHYRAVPGCAVQQDKGECGCVNVSGQYAFLKIYNGR